MITITIVFLLLETESNNIPRSVHQLRTMVRNWCTTLRAQVVRNCAKNVHTIVHNWCTIVHRRPVLCKEGVDRLARGDKDG